MCASLVEKTVHVTEDLRKLKEELNRRGQRPSHGKINPVLIVA